MLSPSLPQWCGAYKVQDTFQAKMIWPRSKLWGRTVSSRSRVDVELFFRGSPDLTGGTSLSIHTNGAGEVPPGPFTNFHLTPSRVYVCGVWLWPQSLAQNCFVQFANFGKDRTLNGEVFIRIRGRVMALSVLYSLDHRWPKIALISLLILFMCLVIYPSSTISSSIIHLFTHQRLLGYLICARK